MTARPAAENAADATKTQKIQNQHFTHMRGRPLGYAAIAALCCEFLFGKETVWNTNNVELLTLKGNMHHRKTGRYRLQKAASTKTFPSVSVIPQNESRQSVSMHTDSRSRISCYYRSARERTVYAQVHRPFQTQHCCWDCCSSWQHTQLCSSGLHRPALQRLRLTLERLIGTFVAREKRPES